MIRSPGAAGSKALRTRSLFPAIQRHCHSLAIGALSLCLLVALTVLSIKVTMAMPIRRNFRLFLFGPFAKACAMIDIATGPR